MEQIDWMADLEGKPPVFPSLMKVWNTRLVAAWKAMTEDDQRQIRMWYGNACRRSPDGMGPTRSDGRTWFDAWPGWVALFGPKPYEGALYEALGFEWHRLHPEQLQRAINKPRTRRPIKLSVRLRVLERDKFRCHYCGVSARETKLVIDHAFPFSKGGADDPTNYVAACEPCNGGKSDRILEGISA